MDGFTLTIQSQAKRLMVLVDMGDGQTLELAEVTEENPGKVVAWLKPLAQRYRVEVIVTDDLFCYPVGAITWTSNARCATFMPCVG
jgi:hypothetical protein